MKETLRKKDEMDPGRIRAREDRFRGEASEAGRFRDGDRQGRYLTAPFTGTVVSLNVLKGDAIKAYDPVCIIADTSN